MWQEVCRLLICPIKSSSYKKNSQTQNQLVQGYLSLSSALNKNRSIKKQARSGNVGVYREMVRPWVARSWHSPRWAPSSWSSWPAPPAAAVAVGRLPSSRPWGGLSPQPAAQHSQVHYYNLGPGVHIQYIGRETIFIPFTLQKNIFLPSTIQHHTILGYRFAFCINRSLFTATTRYFYALKTHRPQRDIFFSFFSAKQKEHSAQVSKIQSLCE